MDGLYSPQFLTTDRGLLMHAIRTRHSVRAYTGQPLTASEHERLLGIVDELNTMSGLHMQLVTDEPRAFSCLLARYGRFSGVTHYVALVGQRGPRLDERCGYWGERLVLEAQLMGLRTCWVGLSYRRTPGTISVGPGERLRLVIAIGHEAKPGVPHRSKRPQQVAPGYDAGPDWFRRGVDAALLAPTALNQQKFTFRQEGDRVTSRAALGFYSRVDLGIARLHFLIGAGEGPFFERREG